MRTVLCYGDSNTHGQVPGGTLFDRYPYISGGPACLPKSSATSWHVIEEGLSGRTTVRDDPIEGAIKNGRTYLRPCIMSHAPLDLIIIMLGTNDLKARFSQPASEVAMGIGCLVTTSRSSHPGQVGLAPEILVVSPPPMLDDIKEWEQIFKNAPPKSRELALEFEIIADFLEVHFFDAGSVVDCDPLDGFHINQRRPRRIGGSARQGSRGHRLEMSINFFPKSKKPLCIAIH